MNIKYHFIASCLLLSGGLAMLTGCSSPQNLKEFTVENPLDINREDEALVLTRAQLNPTDKLLKPVITNGQENGMNWHSYIHFPLPKRPG